MALCFGFKLKGQKLFSSVDTIGIAKGNKVTATRGHKYPVITIINVILIPTDADVIVCAAGSPRKPGMSRDDLFSINATIVYQHAEAMAQFAPNAALAIVTNPVNSVVPIAANVLWQVLT